MNKQEKFGEDIRVQGGLSSGEMTELYYNEATGHYETRPKGSGPNANETNVTAMTERGFAANCCDAHIEKEMLERLKMEDGVLRRYLPKNAYMFKDIDTKHPYMLAAAKTNRGNVYTLHFDLTDFPKSVPKVWVTKMLERKDGSKMDSVSASDHTLSPNNGCTTICHFSSDAWTPMVALSQVWFKCRLWLEIYEITLLTGKPMDYYLNHQTN